MAMKPQVDDVIAGALFDFVGHLACLPELAPHVTLLRHELDQWAQERSLELLDADVLTWELQRQGLKQP
jgi:hypothetical protein